MNNALLRRTHDLQAICEVSAAVRGRAVRLMAEWHLAPDSFSWPRAAAALAGGPPPAGNGAAPVRVPDIPNGAGR